LTDFGLSMHTIYMNVTMRSKLCLLKNWIAQARIPALALSGGSTPVAADRRI
jgi:hypothetical protein